MVLEPSRQKTDQGMEPGRKVIQECSEQQAVEVRWRAWVQYLNTDLQGAEGEKKLIRGSATGKSHTEPSLNPLAEAV